MATTETSKQVATKSKAQDLAITTLNQNEVEAWVDDLADTAELLIPKAILMQAVSQLVQESTCSSGDIIRSTDKKVLGNSKKPFTFIPFHMSRTWIENKYDGGMYSWDHERPYTAENANDEWEYEVDGAKWKRQKAYNFYALLPDETDPTALPIIKLQFKSGSARAGTQLADFFARISVTNKTRKMQGLGPIPPAFKTWKLSSKLMEGDKNKYQAFQVEQGPDSTKEQIEQAASWYMMMKTQPTKVKEHEVKENTEGSVVSEADAF